MEPQDRNSDPSNLKEQKYFVSSIYKNLQQILELPSTQVDRLRDQSDVKNIKFHYNLTGVL